MLFMIVSTHQTFPHSRPQSPVPALHTPHSTLLKPPAACLPPPTPRKPRARPWTLKRCTETVCTFFRGAYHSFGINIIVFLTLLVIVMVGYPLQSIQNKMQPPKKMTEMKKIVEVMKVSFLTFNNAFAYLGLGITLNKLSMQKPKSRISGNTEPIEL